MSFDHTLKLCHRIVILLLLGTGAPVFADPVRHVDAGEDLSRMIARAAPGTIFMLAGGEYGTLSLRRTGGTLTAPVTLRAAEPENPPKFSEMLLNEAKHIVLDGLMFDHTFTIGDRPRNLPFQVRNSEHITIQNSLFDGDVQRGGDPITEGFPTAFGLSIRYSSSVTVSNTEIRRFYRGLLFSRSQNLNVLNNHLHDIRMDGMNFSQVENLLVENNILRDFARAVESGDHADMIQFWTAGTDAPSRNIVIRGNVLNSGFLPHTQSIFMRNEVVDRGQAGEEMYYQNLLIEENVIVNAHLHGITVGETNGLTIRRNALIYNSHSAGDPTLSQRSGPQIRVRDVSKNVRISGNIAHALPDVPGRADWHIAENVLVHNTMPSAPGYYDSVFRGGMLGDPRDLESFFPNPDGPLATAEIGPILLQDTTYGQAARDALPAWERRTGILIQAKPGQSTAEVSFKISPGAGLDPALLQRAEIEWDLGDRSTAQGMSLIHRYDKPNIYDVEARVRLADGQLLTRHSRIRVQSNEILFLDGQAC